MSTKDLSTDKKDSDYLKVYITPEHITVIHLFVALLFVIMLNIMAIKYAQNLVKPQEIGWKNLVANSNYPEEPTAIHYHFSGNISDITDSTITISDQDKTETLKTIFAKYTVVNSASNVQEWPTQIAVKDSKTEFKVGDHVDILISGDKIAQPSKETFLPLRIIKTR